MSDRTDPGVDVAKRRPEETSYGAAIGEQTEQTPRASVPGYGINLVDPGAWPDVVILKERLITYAIVRTNRLTLATGFRSVAEGAHVLHAHGYTEQPDRTWHRFRTVDHPTARALKQRS